MLLLRSFSAGLGASRSLLATATAAVATRSSLSSPLSLRHWSDSPAGGSPFNEDSSANKSFGNFGNQQSGEKPDWDAIIAAKEARIEKAVQLWSEGKLFSEIAPELGYEKPLSIGTIREYLFGRARKDEDFANSLRENWERVVWESGFYDDCTSLEEALAKQDSMAASRRARYSGSGERAKTGGYVKPQRPSGAGKD